MLLYIYLIKETNKEKREANKRRKTRRIMIKQNLILIYIFMYYNPKTQ